MHTRSADHSHLEIYNTAISPHAPLETSTLLLLLIIPLCATSWRRLLLLQVQDQPASPHTPQQKIHPVLAATATAALLLLWLAARALRPAAVLAAASGCRRTQQRGAPNAPERARHEASTRRCEAPAQVLTTRPACRGCWQVDIRISP